MNDLAFLWHSLATGLGVGCVVRLAVVALSGRGTR